MYKDIERKWIIFLNIFSLIVFSFLAIGYSNGILPGSFDQMVYQNTYTFHGPFITNFMKSVGLVFHPGVLLFLGVLTFFVFAMQKNPMHGLIFVLSTFFGILTGIALKEYLSVSRPVGLLAETGLSFPSIHATAASTFFLSSVYALRDYIREGATEDILTVLSISILLMVGLSRLYLQVHWFSDILGGFTLGVFWVTLFIIVYNVQLRKEHNKTILDGKEV